MNIVGHTDRLSVQPTQVIRFLVSCVAPRYRADIVALGVPALTQSPRMRAALPPIIRRSSSASRKGQYLSMWSRDWR